MVVVGVGEGGDAAAVGCEKMQLNGLARLRPCRNARRQPQLHRQTHGDEAWRRLGLLPGGGEGVGRHLHGLRTVARHGEARNADLARLR